MVRIKGQKDRVQGLRRLIVNKMSRKHNGSKAEISKNLMTYEELDYVMMQDKRASRHWHAAFDAIHAYYIENRKATKVKPSQVGGG